MFSEKMEMWKKIIKIAHHLQVGMNIVLFPGAERYKGGYFCTNVAVSY